MLQKACMIIYLFIYLLVYLLIYLFVYLLIYLFLYLILFYNIFISLIPCSYQSNLGSIPFIDDFDSHFIYSLK